LRRALTPGVIVVTSAAGCSPWFMSDAPVQVRGGFLADGRCWVTIDSTLLFAAVDSARTAYEFRGGIPPVDPRGREEAILACAPSTSRPGEPRIGDRSVVILLNQPAGGRLAVGRYGVVRDAAPRPPFTASLTVFDPRVDHAPGRGVQPLGRVGRVSLNATGGALVLRRVDPNSGRVSGSPDRPADVGAVVGEFAVRAVRIWSL
jgi:hypothetical protein